MSRQQLLLHIFFKKNTITVSTHNAQMEHRVSYWTGTHRPWHPHSILHRCKLSHHHSRPLATPYHTHTYTHKHTMTISHKSYITWYHTYTPSITATCTTEQHTLHYAPQYSRTTHNNKPWYTTHHLTTTPSDTSHIQNKPHMDRKTWNTHRQYIQTYMHAYKIVQKVKYQPTTKIQPTCLPLPAKVLYFSLPCLGRKEN
jgi:hypothetical protein